MASCAAVAASFFAALSKWNVMMQSLPRRSYAPLTRRRLPLQIHQSRLACRTFVPSITQLHSPVLVRSSENELGSGNSKDTAQDGGEAKQNGTETISEPTDRSTIDRPIIRNVKIPSQTPSVMRELMRNVPHPVVVITASSWSMELQQMTHQAMTISSFNTVTLNPEPIISFNIRTPSRTLNAILAQKGHFRIHVLSNSQKGSFIADAFTRGNAKEGFKKIQASGINIRFPAGNVLSAPIIATKAVIATLHCVLLPSKTVTIRDHIVALARVTHVNRNERLKMALMYVDRAYRTVGNQIMAHQVLEDKSSPTVSKPQEKLLKERAVSNSTRFGKAEHSPESARSIGDLTKWQDGADRHAQAEAHMRFMTGEARTGPTQQSKVARSSKDNDSSSSVIRKHNSGPYISKAQKERQTKRAKGLERFKRLREAMLRRNQDIEERERMKLEAQGEQVKER